MLGLTFNKTFTENRDENFLQVVSRMSCAIIMQIAKDIAADPNVENETFYSRKRMKQVEKAKNEAIEWIKSEENNFFSINNCCNHINNYMFSIGKCLPLLTPEYLKDILLNDPKSFVENSAGIQEILLMNINDSSDNDYYDAPMKSTSSKISSEALSRMSI